MSKIVDFTVRGTGPFPVDMLRFDECWPVEIHDVAEITRTIDAGSAKTAIIRLRGRQTTSITRPTVGRWDSFGWRVVKSDNAFDPIEAMEGDLR